MTSSSAYPGADARRVIGWPGIRFSNMKPLPYAQALHGVSCSILVPSACPATTRTVASSMHTPGPSTTQPQRNVSRAGGTGGAAGGSEGGAFGGLGVRCVVHRRSDRRARPMLKRGGHRVNARASRPVHASRQDNGISVAAVPVTAADAAGVSGTSSTTGPVGMRSPVHPTGVSHARTTIPSDVRSFRSCPVIPRRPGQSHGRQATRAWSACFPDYRESPGKPDSHMHDIDFDRLATVVAHHLGTPVPEPQPNASLLTGDL